jgi:hypothetical protein
MKNLTHIDIVLDRSGSMESITRETIRGFNAFLKEQKKVKGEAKITLVQFDHEYQLVYEDLSIKRAPELNTETYVPRGMTALLDAIGKTIKATHDKIELLDKNERPSKVIFVVITDGHENHSRYYNRSKIFKKINKMQVKYGWEFVFLGANQDAIAEAGRLGIDSRKAMTYAADSLGAMAMFADLSENISACRSENIPFSFSKDQRDKQERNN